MKKTGNSFFNRQTPSTPMYRECQSTAISYWLTCFCFSKNVAGSPHRYKHLARTFLLLAGLFFFSNNNIIAQIESLEDTPAEKLQEMTENAGDNGKAVKRISLTIFDQLTPAIQEAFTIAELVESKDHSLTKTEQQDVYERVKKINTIYQELSTEKDAWKFELEGKLKEAQQILQQSKIEQQRFERETEKLVRRLDNATKKEEVSPLRLKTMQMSIDLSRKRGEIFSEFQNALGEFSLDNEEVKKNISELLEVIDESAIATSIMVELMEVSIKKEDILNNLEGLENLSEYIDDINNSLQKLGNSLKNLQELRDDHL